MTDQDTAELVRRAAAGDGLAWRQLVDGLGPMLRRVSSTYRLGDAEAADAIATVWLKLVENRLAARRRRGRGLASYHAPKRMPCPSQRAQSRTARGRFRRCRRAGRRHRLRPLAARRRPPTFGASGPDEILRAASSANRDALRRPSAFVCGNKRTPRHADRQHRSYSLEAPRQAPRRHGGRRRVELATAG